MIDSIGTLTTNLPKPAEKPGEAPAGGGFDAALKAAQQAAARDEARRQEMEAIREKGFGDWVRDMRIEKLKEELRRRIMAEMGIAEEDLAKMTDAMREILEAKIREAVDQAVQQELARQEGGEKAAATTPSPQEAPGKDDPPGKKFPVIAALVQAGGESLF